MSKPYQNNQRQGLPILLLILWCAVLAPSLSWALTAANTLIRNQASATFKDETGTVYNVTSNVVETLVQQVAGLDLVQSQTKLASSGATLELPHVVTNTGNGDDTFSLVPAQIAGDDYDFTQITFYADANQDGQADDLSKPLTTTPLLKAGESFAFVAVVDVPATVTDGNQGKLTITAASTFTPTITVMNTDTVKITSNAIVEVTKSLSATSGEAGSGNYTVTLHYQNKSLVNASNVTLIDALPSGMDYVAGSARWSASGSTVLTDTSPNDAQGTNGTTISYCAYDNSCTALPEASRDADNSSVNQVTAVISEVGPGVAGDVSFAIKISNGLPPSTLTNIGEYEFYDGTTNSERTLTNPVSFTVLQTPDVVTNGSNTSNADGTNEPITVASVNQNGTAVFYDYVWNTGTGNDSFDMTLTNSTFPAGTVFQLYQADGYTPLLDTDGNGIPDTGDQAVGSVTMVVLKALLPPSALGNNNGNGYHVTLTATSLKDDSVSNPAINQLDTITSNSVDLTNNAALGQAGVLGAGVGPEANAVTTRHVMPGTTTHFILYVNNTSTAADNFDLQVSTDKTFATLVLPPNWSIHFTDDSGETLSNTGIIAPAGSKRVFAEVTVPQDEPTTLTDLYFQVKSPVTGAMDIKHDALGVGELTDVVLYPDNTGQILPGGSIVYSHWLTNQGTMPKTNITLTHADDSSGWQSVLYEDTDNNGVLSAADKQLTQVASLAVGESKLIFAKVFAAATIPMGSADVTLLTASWDNGAESVEALDVTTTNNSDVTIRKEQALDANCDGQPDTTFGHANFAAEPRQCVIYRLTATNMGAERVVNVKIQDATPAYTSFITANGLPVLSQGTLLTPISNGSTGKVIGVVGTIEAGANATLTFGIKID